MTYATASGEVYLYPLRGIGRTVGVTFADSAA